MRPKPDGYESLADLKTEFLHAIGYAIAGIVFEKGYLGIQPDCPAGRTPSRNFAD
jgi:hypothetical protein